MSRILAWVVVGCSALLLGCSSSESTERDAPTEPSPASSCVAPVGEPMVTVTVDDLVGGFGSFGTRSRSPHAGTVDIVVEAKKDNTRPTTVIIHRASAAGAEVGRVAGVAAGQSCAISLQLEAGKYVVTADTNPGADAEFEVL